jgi:hypothetical protein
LTWQGKDEAAIEAYRRLEESRPPGLELDAAISCRATLEGDLERCLAASRKVLDSRFRDSEGLYFLVRNLAHVGEVDLAISTLDERVVSRGYWCAETFARDPWLAPLAQYPGFEATLLRAREGHEAAKRAYVSAGGPGLLGV